MLNQAEHNLSCAEFINNTHFALIYQTAVQSYCYQVCVQLYFVINGAHTLLGPDKVLYR